VAPITSSCSNGCGEGSQTCEDGILGECQVPEVRVACSTVCGSGTRSCSGGKWLACTAPRPKPPRLVSTIRDFADPAGPPPNDPAYERHPDFERRANGDQPEPGLVQPLLGVDDKPVYASSGPTKTTSGAAYFDEWYRDTPNVNESTVKEFELSSSPDDPTLYVYGNNAFFPIDRELLGNQGRDHNYGFTLETTFNFRYIGGEVFRFSGDDDLWVFINRHLAIDLGGLHRILSGAVELDRRAAEFGLVVGQTYSLHLFFAERHTKDSNFFVETTIADPGTCE
jgi:fibro-slime domain-containing protein